MREAETFRRVNYFKGEVLELWIEDGILCGTYNVENVDLEVASKATEERLAFVNHTTYSSLVDYTCVKTTSKQARDYFAEEKASRYVEAMAILTDSSVGKIIVNFYLFINKPPFPTRIFTSREEGMIWLKNFKKTLQKV